ncbi:NmrA family NAD(P)-binding protein [Phenylobacterium sp.]|uniref:NmrA family NAD(P)-binding protein n=1 Tax=Phenylobacterium sp. TaxID=1871053 RepID=UPI00286ACC23|nr:NmrA family NAD(P)-binding protein [Phenylobacterium sp.]
MFAVMGATGQTGSAVVAELRRRGAQVRALTRDPAGASRLNVAGVDVACADPADPSALTAAFEGMAGAYVMIPPHLQSADVLAEGLATSEAIAQAVRRSGLKHVVALSSGGAHLARGTGVIRTMHDMEAALRRTSASVTFLRASDFMENWAFAAPIAIEHGVVPSGRTPLDGPMETVSTLDIGRVAAECLLDFRDGERVVNLLGPREYSPREVAEAYGRALGKLVEVAPLPRAALVPTYMEAGLGEDYARGLAEVYDGLNAGLIGFEPGVGETRRGSVTLDEAIARILA